MYSRQYLHKKTSSNTSSKPVQTNLSQQRPFKDEADSAALPQQQQETPDLQTQLERAARFGHNFGRVQVHGDTPSAAIQPKLAIGAPGDKYEQEADAVADKVMSMDAPKNLHPVQRQETSKPKEEEQVQTKPLAASITPLIQRESAPEHEEEQVQPRLLSGFAIQRDAAPEQEEERVQTKRSQQHLEAGNSEAGNDLESRLSNSKGGGSPLPDDVRSFMEPRFGTDFSQVRVHTDSNAVQMNKELRAQAFTHGRDVYFGAGKSPDKSELTAHELTHVVQQTGVVQSKLIQDQSMAQRKCSNCEQEEEMVQRSLNVSSSPQILQRREACDDGTCNEADENPPVWQDRTADSQDREQKPGNHNQTAVDRDQSQNTNDQGQTTDRGQEQNTDNQNQTSVDPTLTTVEPVPELSGTSEPYEVVAFANTLDLQGETKASYNGSWQSSNQKTTPGGDCNNCEPSDCVHVTGTLTNTYKVSTEVTLPPVPNDLTPCQKNRVRTAITTVLAPHEQKHVKAFHTFDGVTKQPFDLTVCRSDVNSTLQSMHDAERQTRQATAQAKSDALDPFNVPVDLDCKD